MSESLLSGWLDEGWKSSEPLRGSLRWHVQGGLDDTPSYLSLEGKKKVGRSIFHWICFVDVDRYPLLVWLGVSEGIGYSMTKRPPRSPPFLT